METFRKILILSLTFVFSISNKALAEEFVKTIKVPRFLSAPEIIPTSNFIYAFQDDKPFPFFKVNISNKDKFIRRQKLVALDIQRKKINSAIKLGKAFARFGLKFNESSNRIYISDGIKNILVIDPEKNKVIDKIPLDSELFSLTVNPSTNKIYVVHTFSDEISVIDGSTNKQVSKIPVGSGPSFISVNPVTNKLFVSYGSFPNFSGQITVIDSQNDRQGEDIFLSDQGFLGQLIIGNIAVDINLNKLFFGEEITQSFFIVDLNMNNATTVLDDIPPGCETLIDSTSNKVYISYACENNLNEKGDFVPKVELIIIDGSENKEIQRFSTTDLNFKKDKIVHNSGIVLDTKLNLLYLLRNDEISIIDTSR